MLTPIDGIVTRLAVLVAYLGQAWAPPLRTEAEIQLPSGYSLRLAPGLPSARRLQSGSYEPEVTELFQSLLQPGMTLVDVGANVGYYTLMAAGLVGDTGHVYAFEPEADVYEYLRENVRRSGARHVEVIPKAVSDRTGQSGFTPSALEGGFLSVLDPGGIATRLVETVTLDAFFASRGWPRVDLIKLDAEGAEGLVLGGMSMLSAANPSLRLVMEFNLVAMHRSGSSPESVRMLLGSLGFKVGHIIELGLKAISLSDPLPRSGLIYNLLLTKG